jgi:hypothetical protein
VHRCARRGETRRLCRCNTVQRGSLPCTFHSRHVNGCLCHVLSRIHTTNLNHSWAGKLAPHQKVALCRVPQKKNIDKVALCRVSNGRHTGKKGVVILLLSVRALNATCGNFLICGTRQRESSPCVFLYRVYFTYCVVL